jgi:N-acetylglutamate synthase-like GNAT family acetyltransferase
MNYRIRKTTNDDINKLEEIVKNSWGSSIIVTKRKQHHVKDLLGYVVEEKDKIIAYGLYEIRKRQCEIIVLEAIDRGKGYGRIILDKIVDHAKKDNCKKIWLITTNDNISALKYWQKAGFCISNIKPGEMVNYRTIKPEIPLIGEYGIKIMDEIEMEQVLLK